MAYDLAVFDNFNGTPSITVGAVTKSFPGVFPLDDWSSLVEGTHYVLFHPVASVGGTVTFIPNANATGIGGFTTWTAFQIQSAVPEPSEYAFASGLLSLGVAVWLRQRKSLAA